MRHLVTSTRGALAVALLAMTAACTSGSSGGAPHASGTPSTSTSASPDTLVNDSLVTLPATAVVQVGSSSSTLHTASNQPLQLEASPSGSVSVTLAMHGSGTELFSVEGPAAVGRPLTTDHVVIFLSSGILIDTVQGNPCTATYDVLSEKHVSATFRCLTREGAAKVPVTVRLTAAG